MKSASNGEGPPTIIDWDRWGEPIFGPSVGDPTVHGSTKTLSESRIKWDALDRMELVKSPANYQGNAIQSMQYMYDEKGNKRGSINVYSVQNQANQDSKLIYTYDKENRINSFTQYSGEYVLSRLDYDLDALGQRTFEYKKKQTFDFESGSHPELREKYTVDVTQVTQFIYDDLGNLEDTKLKAIADFKLQAGVPGESSVEDTGDAVLINDKIIDDWGRTTEEIFYDVEWLKQYNVSTSWTKQDFVNNLFTVTKKSRTSTKYNSVNQTTTQHSWQFEDNGVSWNSSKVDFSNGYDYAGNQIGYEVTVYKQVDNGYSSTEDYRIHYSTEYDYFDTYKQKKLTAERSDNQGNPGVTEYFYDLRGNLRQVTQQDEQDPTENFTRFYQTNRSGQIVYQTKDDNTQTYYYANNKTIADLGGLKAADFDYNTTNFAKQVKQASPSLYVVNSGDTLKGIAATVYGDASLWYVIADANGVASDEELVQGQNLTIPAHINNANNADTFRPYNPNDIIGDTSPIALAPPPPGPRCAEVAQLIQIVVTIVVSYFAGPHMAKAAAAAVGAAAGDTAGQTVSIIGGDQDSFDVGRTITAAASAAASAGVSNEIGGATGVMVGTATGQITSGLLNRIRGEEIDFSGRSFAASVLSSGINELLFGEIGGDFVTDFLASVGKSAIDYNVQKANGVKDAEWNWGMVAANAFGTAIGNSIVRQDFKESIKRALEIDKLTAENLARGFGGIKSNSSDSPSPQENSSDNLQDSVNDTHNPELVEVKNNLKMLGIPVVESETRRGFLDISLNGKTRSFNFNEIKDSAGAAQLQRELQNFLGKDIAKNSGLLAVDMSLYNYRHKYDRGVASKAAVLNQEAGRKRMEYRANMADAYRLEALKRNSYYIENRQDLISHWLTYDRSGEVRGQAEFVYDVVDKGMKLVQGTAGMAGGFAGSGRSWCCFVCWGICCR